MEEPWNTWIFPCKCLSSTRGDWGTAEGGRRENLLKQVGWAREWEVGWAVRKVLGTFPSGEIWMLIYGLYSNYFNLIFRKKLSSASDRGGKEFGEERKTRKAFNCLCTLRCEHWNCSHPHGRLDPPDLLSSWPTVGGGNRFHRRWKDGITNNEKQCGQKSSSRNRNLSKCTLLKGKTSPCWNSGQSLSAVLSLNRACFTKDVCLRTRHEQSQGSASNFLDLVGINWGLHATLTRFENKVPVNKWRKWVSLCFIH